MGKRNNDCTLDEIIAAYLKKAKCQKTLKLFGEQIGQAKNDKMPMLEKFVDYMKEQEAGKENKRDDDLGFEINFGAFQPEKKVSSGTPSVHSSYFQLPSISGKIGGKLKETNRKDVVKEKKVKEIPKEFIKKIEKLGMKKEDAEVLYKTQIDWTAVYSKNKLHCAETGCDFYTEIDNDDMTNHMVNFHKYGDYPCDDPHCNYVAYSKVKKTKVS